MSGTLYLCATPIGNLDDITLRALELLKNCGLIAAEDTRHTLKLLNHFDITTPMVSYHEHNKHYKGPQLIQKLNEGIDIALVTDAGTPGISDPGEDLVKLCYENNVAVTAAPGAAAVVTALILSGFSTRRFVFEAFLPVDKRERRDVLKSLEKESRTVVLYEAPHHLISTLEELHKALGNRYLAVIRELTKRYEEVKRGTLSDMIEYFSTNPPRGEFVLVLEGLSKEILKNDEIMEWKSISIEEHMQIYINKELNQKDAMKQVAKDRGVSKREIYAYLNQ